MEKNRKELGEGACANKLRIIMSGRRTLTADMPIPDFAIPYAAPRLEKIMATAQPIHPKKDCSGKDGD